MDLSRFFPRAGTKRKQPEKKDWKKREKKNAVDKRLQFLLVLLVLAVGIAALLGPWPRSFYSRVDSRLAKWGSSIAPSIMAPEMPEPGLSARSGLPLLQALATATEYCGGHGGQGAEGTCLCLKGYAGDRCQVHVRNALISENEAKFDGYAKTICPKKLSTSGMISDATVRLGAKIAAERLSVPHGASATLYDACVGCGGWMRAFREIRPAIQLVGCDISVGIINHTAGLFPAGVFVSGGGTDPPSLFLPDDSFDIVTAGFCMNNIGDETMLRVANAAMAIRVKALCVGVRDLFRVAKPGGGIYIPQYYEKDAPADKKWQHWPLHLLGSCFPDLELTKEDSSPACNVRVRGGVVYSWEETLYREAQHEDRYYMGKMKTVFIHKPIDPTAAAVRTNCSEAAGAARRLVPGWT